MAGCDDTRQLTEAQRQAGYQNQRTGVQRAIRPFSGRPTLDNLIDYINRELQPAVRQTRDAVNDIYLPAVDNAPSGNPLAFYFSTETGAADPTTGRVRLNQATQDTATILRVSETNGRLANVAPWLDVMAGGATTPLGVVTLSDVINPTRFIRFDLNTMTDQGAYWDLGVTVIESSHDNPFVDDGGVVISFIPGVASTGVTLPPSALTPIAANTVLGNPTASTAAPTAIAVPVNTVVGRKAGNIVVETVATDQIGDDQVTNAKLAEAAANTVKANATASTANPTDFAVAENSVLGRAGAAGTGNIEAITVPGTGTLTGESVFLQSSSLRNHVRWSNLTLAALPLMSDNQFIGNLSGATARPIYTDFSELSSTSVSYENVGKSFIREALSGDVVALQNANETTIQPNVVSNTKLRDSGALSVIGRSANSSGDPADISATAASDAVLRESGSALGFGTIATGGLADNSVTNAKLADMPGATVKGRQVDAATGDPVDLTGLEVAELIRFGTTQAVSLTAGTTNDQALNADANVLRVTPSGAQTLTGVAGGDQGRLLVIENIAGSGNTLTLTSLDAGSAVANRFRTPNGQSVLLRFRESAVLRWESNNGDWRVIASARATVVGDADYGDITVTASGLTWTIDNDVVSDAKLRNSAALSVIGRSANSTGDPADIVAANDAEVLRRSGTTLGFGTVATAGIADSAVTLAKMANLATGTVIGRQIDAGTGVPVALTGLEVGELWRKEFFQLGSALSIETPGTYNDVALDERCSHVFINPSAGDVTITGWALGSSNTGGFILVQKEGSDGRVILAHNTGSVAANQHWCPNDESFVLSRSNECAILWYGGGRWRVAGSTRFAPDRDYGDVTVTNGGTTWTIDNDVVSDAKLRNSGALSVIGRSANSAGDPADISVAAASGAVLRESGSVLGFGTIATAGIADDAVTNAKLADMTAGTVKGRQVDAATGDPVDLTGLEVAELIRFGTAQAATLAATTNDFSLNADTTVLRLTSTTGSQTLTGITGGAAGRALVIENVSADGNPIVLTSLDAGSSVGNRIRTPRNQSLTIGFRENAVLLYSALSVDWRVAAMGTTSLTDGDKGDITVSSSGTVWTIDSNAVTDAKLRQGTACSVIGRTANTLGNVADIAATVNDRVLTRASDTVAFRQIANDMIADGTIALGKIAGIGANTVIGNATASTTNPAAISVGTNTVLGRVAGNIVAAQLATGQIADDAVTDGKLRNSAALSVIGRSANSTGDPADIAAGTDAHVLRRSGTTLGFGQVEGAGIAANAVTNARLAQMNQSTIKGRAESAGTGDPQDLTSTEVVAIIDGEPVTWRNDHVFTEDVRFESTFRLSGVLTTATTAANNLAIGPVNAVRFTGPVDPLTGMVAEAAHQVVVLLNTHATANMAVHLESASSTASNRFAGVGTSRIIKAGEMALAWYDNDSSRWRLLCRDDADL